MPPSLEQSVLGDAPYFFGPLQAPLYIATKVSASIKRILFFWLNFMGGEY